MCQSYQTKEEVFLAQNAAGGAGNTANLKDIGTHLSMQTIMSAVIICMMCAIFIYLGFKAYKKCHTRWMRQEMNLQAFRGVRLSGRGRGRGQNQPKAPEHECQCNL